MTPLPPAPFSTVLIPRRTYRSDAKMIASVLRARARKLEHAGQALAADYLLDVATDYEAFAIGIRTELAVARREGGAA